LGSGFFIYFLTYLLLQFFFLFKEKEGNKGVMAGGGKAEEPQAHPPKEQLPGISYCITSPPPWREHSLSF
jgi:hypothetical protein